MSAVRPIGLAPGSVEQAAGQDGRKYQSTNPLVQWLISRLLAAVEELVNEQTGLLIDVGVGEGLALERVLPPGSTVVGLDYRRDKLEVAGRRLPGLLATRADAGMLPVRSGVAHTVTCLEVLEHLVVFEPAIAELARITQGRCIVTVPWEPWFRLGNLARGKNVRRKGNDLEHVQAFSRRSLRNGMAASFHDVEVRTKFPWLLAIAARPR